MYTLLVVLHITFMVSSLVLMPLAILMAATGKRWSMGAAFFGMMSACFGSVAGTVLLISSPVLSTCVLLTAYTVLMISLYGYGFGWGNEERARLIKNTEAR